MSEKMPPAWIIEEEKRRLQEEEDRRREQERPQPYAPGHGLPDERKDDHDKDQDTGQRGVIHIQS